VLSFDILVWWHCYIDGIPEGNVFGEVGAVVIDAVKLKGQSWSRFSLARQFQIKV
jgi:hypothetical protein